MHSYRKGAGELTPRPRPPARPAKRPPAAGVGGGVLAGAAMRATGCPGVRTREPNGRSVDPAQRENRRRRDATGSPADGLRNPFGAAVEPMTVMTRASGRDDTSGFERRDLAIRARDVPATRARGVPEPTGVERAGVERRRWG